MPRLLGLCQVQPQSAQPEGDSLSSLWAPWAALLQSPVLSDLLVWLLLRLYGRLLRSRTYSKVQAGRGQQQHQREGCNGGAGGGKGKCGSCLVATLHAAPRANMFFVSCHTCLQAGTPTW